ncbi:MAG: hypothetical protein IKZ48_05830 [Prevotella sp.]|nr:hypothetical protein [Prevotella sp.]
MKRYALAILFAVLASLNLTAQEAGAFVVSDNGQDVLFHVDEVDSICFNPADTSKAVSARQLLATLVQLADLKDDVAYAKDNVDYALNLLSFLIYQKERLSDSIDVTKERLGITKLRVDSLAALFNIRLDSIDTASAIRSARNDSLFQDIDNRLLRSDSVDARMNSMLDRIDSVIHYSDSVFKKLEHAVRDTINVKLAQSIAVQEQQQQVIDRLNATVDSLSAALTETKRRMNDGQVLTDVSTGQVYKMVLNNGVITTIPAYNNILVVGNSFTVHDYVEDLWWSTHSMAASTADVTWVKYLEEVSGAQVDILRGWDFEWNYPWDGYPFETGLPISRNDYDVVIVQIQENAMQVPDFNFKDGWERLYTYLKGKCPNSIYMQCIGWDVEARTADITEAAAEFNIPIVDNRVETMTGNFRVGDYVYSNVDSIYYPINNGSVANHPSDVGFLLTANNVLRQLNLPTVENRMHAINIIEAEGGQLSVPYPSWPEKGVVSVRVEPEPGHTLASVSVVTASGKTVEITKRTNELYEETDHDYYTFLMPTEDITVTPVWE